jgi:hypothetical protein
MEGAIDKVSPLHMVPTALVYAAESLRMALTVDLGNGLHGIMVYTRSDNSFTFLHSSNPCMTNMTSMPFLDPAPAPTS